ncbi:MAG: LamG domain-containing protein, partial [Chlamydiae bacterium]|nr:LamG domain-containing protein [Chlamydiota bacterium]
TSAVTLEAWINPSSVSSSTRQYLMQKSSETWGFYMASSKLYFYTDTKDDGGSRLVLSSSIQANRWTHVAGTYDKNAGVMVLYVDGTLKSSKIQKGHLGSTLDNLYVGSYGTGPTYAYNGRIDELRIYNMALSQEMIQGDMEKGIPDEVLHYNFDDGTATDPSHCENNGKLSGVTSVAGYSANGLSFNGSGYVCVPDSATLDAEDALTVEAWVYPTNMAAKNQQYILQRSGGTWGIYIYKGNVSFFTDTTHKGGSWITCSASMKGNVWSHVAGVYDSKTGTMSLYMNGTLAASKSQSKELDVTPLSLYLGNGGTSTTYAFYGILDEMRIYRKALSKDEILSDAEI